MIIKWLAHMFILLVFGLGTVGCFKNEVDEAKAIMEEQIPLLLGNNAEDEIFKWCKSHQERVKKVVQWLKSPEGQTEEARAQFKEIEDSGLYNKYRNALMKPTPSSMEAKRKLRECVIYF